MRDIKFRAWDSRHKRMNYDSDSVSVGVMNGVASLCSNSMQFNEFTMNKPDSFKLEQYTGLKDKNGVEIYEGDLMAIEARWGGFIGEIRYHDENAMFVLWDLDTSQYHNSHDLYFSYREVIGNIHENKELLEETNES